MGIFVGKNGKTAAFFTLFALGLYLGFQYLLPLAGPFALAFAAVYALWPGLDRLAKRSHLRREVLLGFILIVLAALVCLGAWALLRWGAEWAPQLYRNLSAIEEQLERWLRGGCDLLEKNFGVDAKEAERIIIQRLEIFAEQMQINIWPTAAKQSFSYLKSFGKAAAFLGIGFIAALLLCRDYEGIVKKMNAHPVLEILWSFLEKTVKMVGGYVKAQALIICAISTIAVAGLWISRVNGAFLWGLLAGILDALPFIGTGVVLLPLAVWQLLNGSFWKTAAVALCYVLCVAAREFLEPRLLGKQLGISPVIMLFSVYAGVKVFGIAGLFLGPLYAMLLREGCRMYAAYGAQRERETGEDE